MSQWHENILSLRFVKGLICKIVGAKIVEHRLHFGPRNRLLATELLVMPGVLDICQCDGRHCLTFSLVNISANSHLRRLDTAALRLLFSPHWVILELALPEIYSE